MTLVDARTDPLQCLGCSGSGDWKGVRYVVVAVVAEGGRAAGIPVLYSIHRPHVPAGTGAVRRARAVAGTQDRDQRPAGGRAVGRGPPHVLPPVLQPHLLVAVAAGEGAGGDGAGPGPAGRAGRLPG